MAIAIKRDVRDEIVRRLINELEYYGAIIDKFRKKYGCSLEELEEKIEREGVPLDKHEIWEDSIEWRNAEEEADQLRKLLKELES
ncbi:MAG: hypothetical protein H0Z28_10840 [Archaeoglobus sp.]|nr:hypothetical protein [Archaeoglobus sp.]